MYVDHVGYLAGDGPYNDLYYYDFWEILGRSRANSDEHRL